MTSNMISNNIVAKIAFSNIFLISLAVVGIALAVAGGLLGIAPLLWAGCGVVVLALVLLIVKICLNSKQAEDQLDTPDANDASYACQMWVALEFLRGVSTMIIGFLAP